MYCDVEFENQNKLFVSGQEVKGVIKIDNHEPQKINGISLIIDGIAKTHWTESTGTGTDGTSTSYGGTQQLIFSKIPLIKNDGVMTLNPGNHKFNFNFLLHPLLPSSIDKLIGKIIYSIVVEIERAETFSLNKRYKFKFDVIGHVDLNLEKPELRAPLKAEISKGFFMSSKTCTIAAEIPHQAFAGGQDFSVSLSINNESKQEITSIILTLLREYEFKCTGVSTTSDRDVLINSIQGGLEPQSKHSATYSFKIPSGLFPTIDSSNSKYIDVTYKLEITAKVGGMHRSPRVYLPIYIGSVPYKF